jgi:hypothetical protein
VGEDGPGARLQAGFEADGDNHVLAQKKIWDKRTIVDYYKE